MSTELSLPPRVMEVQEFLRGSQVAIAKAAGEYMTADRAIQVAVLCAYRNPELLKCDKSSLLASVVQAAALGLDLSPGRGEAYIIPRWNSKAGVTEAQFQPGYRGLAKLAREAAGLRYIQAELVHQKDQFEVWRDPDQRIIHKPCLATDRGGVTHVYAVSKLATGEIQVTVMTFDEVEAIRRKSQKPDAGPWREQWGEMAKKTVVKRLCKMLPDTVDRAAGSNLNAAIEADNREYEGGPDAIAGPDNASGFGKGMYASHEQTAVYLKALDDYLARRNAGWLDSWSKGGEPADGVGDLKVSRWQADNHLVKWAVETGRLAAMDVTEGVKNRQIGRFTAIVYHRSTEDRKALAQEMRRYLDEQCERATERLKRDKPELFPPDVESQEVEAEDIEGVDDGFQPFELEPAGE